MAAHDPVGNDASDPLALLFSSALDMALIHPRIEQQGFWSEQNAQALLDKLSPRLCGFPGRTYEGLRIVVDWDHKLPSQSVQLRVFASYTAKSLDRLDADLAQIAANIERDNLYPEFDVPDFNAITTDEVYVQSGNLSDDGRSLVLDEIRFYSDWRRQVDPEVAARVQTALESTDSFKLASNSRDEDNQFSQAILVGWTPPCAARSRHWALELWLVTHFQGRFGKARVFMVDSENLALSHSFDTEIQLAA